MKHWKKVCLSIVLIGILAGCGKPEDIEVTPTGVVSDILTKVEKELVEDNSVIGLCEMLEQKDASEQAKYNAMNRMLSSNNDENQQSLFCVDEKTGVVYFVNQNKDWYIYRLKDGEVKLAVPLPAKELYIWEETVYFMLDSYGKYDLGEAKTGDIYAYTPADGSVKLIYSVSEKGSDDYKLTVNEAGIFFSCSNFMEVNMENGRETFAYMPYYGYLPFGEKEAVEDKNHMTFAGWKDYYFIRMPDENGKVNLYLESRVGKAGINLGQVILSCVIGDELYYILSDSKLSVRIRNLESGEERIYSCEEALYEAFTEAPDYAGINSFVVVEDNIWATSGGVWLFRIEMQGGDVTYYRMSENRGMLHTLYTDGKQLYALYANAPTADGYPVRVLTEQIEWNDMLQVQTMGVEYLTK